MRSQQCFRALYSCLQDPACKTLPGIVPTPDKLEAASSRHAKSSKNKPQHVLKRERVVCNHCKPNLASSENA